MNESQLQAILVLLRQKLRSFAPQLRPFCDPQLAELLDELCAVEQQLDALEGPDLVQTFCIFLDGIESTLSVIELWVEEDLILQLVLMRKMGLTLRGSLKTYAADALFLLDD